MRTAAQSFFDRKFQEATPELMQEILLSIKGMEEHIKLSIQKMLDNNELDDARLALSNWHYENQLLE